MSTLYRITITFTDGVFTVDAWASSPDRALCLAMADARMGHPGGSYFGKILSYHIEEVMDAPIAPT